MQSRAGQKYWELRCVSDPAAPRVFTQHGTTPPSFPQAGISTTGFLCCSEITVLAPLYAFAKSRDRRKNQLRLVIQRTLFPCATESSAICKTHESKAYSTARLAKEQNSLQNRYFCCVMWVCAPTSLPDPSAQPKGHVVPRATELRPHSSRARVGGAAQVDADTEAIRI